RVAAFPLPVVAALNGHALGGGAEVAIAADIRVAADDVKIGFNQVSLGIMPAWGGAERLAQVVGRGRALLAVATGELYDARRKVARSLAGTAPGTTRAVKAVIGAAVPSTRPDLEGDATDAFARLWT